MRRLLTKQQACERIQSPKLLARLIHQALHPAAAETPILQIVPGGRGRATLISEASLDNAIGMLLSDYRPPKFPSER